VAPAGTWYPGNNWAGYQVHNVPTVFAQPVTFQGTAGPVFQGNPVVSGALTVSGAATVSGLFTAQKGVATIPPFVATPGTVATLGTVTNSLGFNVVVYASAVSGIQAAKVGTYSVPGSTIAGDTATYYVASGNSITLTYTGNLTWLWQAI
jgi:hypothetical protein